MKVLKMLCLLSVAVFPLTPASVELQPLMTALYAKTANLMAP